ncbi:hypothetical protein KJ942_08850 [bacterium]|nr:hypothetical protein [bacterium]
MIFSLFFNFLMSAFDILEFLLENEIDIFSPLLKPKKEVKKSKSLSLKR